MTIEHRTTVSIEEIQAVVLACNNANCKARVEVPVAAFDLEAFHSCPSCGKDWLPPTENARLPGGPRLLPVAVFLNGLKAMLAQPQVLGFTLLLQLGEAQN